MIDKSGILNKSTTNKTKSFVLLIFSNIGIKSVLLLLTTLYSL